MSCHASHPEPSWNIFMGPYNIDFNNYRLLCEIWDPDKNWDCQKPKRFWMTLAVALKSGKCSIRLDRGCSSVVYTPREVAMSISRSARTAILGDQVDGRVQQSKALIEWIDHGGDSCLEELVFNDLVFTWRTWTKEKQWNELYQNKKPFQQLTIIVWNRYTT